MMLIKTLDPTSFRVTFTRVEPRESKLRWAWLLVAAWMIVVLGAVAMAIWPAVVQ